MSKYELWYNNLIERAKLRTFSENTYYENHHILPRCIGGTNNKDNLVLLTAREHFICHYLLTKIHTGSNRRRMIFAFWSMAKRISPTQQRNYKITNRLYEKLRINWQKALQEENIGKPSNNKGRTLTPEWREKLRRANSGKKRSLESIEKQRATITGRKRLPRSDEWRLKLSISRKENMTDAQKQAISERNKNRTFIYNDAEHKCKWVKNNQIDLYLNSGWQVGRKRYKR